MFTTNEIEDIIKDFFAKCEEHGSVGIALCDAVNGTPVPVGWQLNLETAYYLPPFYSLERQ